MKYLAIMLLSVLAMITDVSAGELSLRMTPISKHADDSYPYNETHHGRAIVYTTKERAYIEAGVYENSFHKDSFYISFGKDTGGNFAVGAMVWAAWGYIEGKPMIAVAPYIQLFKRVKVFGTNDLTVLQIDTLRW